MNTAERPAADTPPAGGYLTVAQAAKILGVAPRTIVRWADDGVLAPAMRTRGKHRRFAPETVENLRRQLAGQTEDE